jgi:light-regulated signal transduction histidine kinase (bacteriophytochrome)
MAGAWLIPVVGGSLVLAAVTVWIWRQQAPLSLAAASTALAWALGAALLRVRLAARRVASLTRANRRLLLVLATAPSPASRPTIQGAPSHAGHDPVHVSASLLELLQRTSEAAPAPAVSGSGELPVAALAQLHLGLEGLREYSRLAGGGESLAAVDAREAVGEALATLGREIHEAGALIAYGPLPAVTADPVQLPRLFQHLIANAVKFRGGERPYIQVSAEDGGGEWIFVVRDNGIGIDPRHAELIFEPFQRLHTAEEYPGEGMGLPIARRIVERHGGRMWVRSWPGGGAAFYFTLPKQPVACPLQPVASPPQPAAACLPVPAAL